MAYTKLNSYLENIEDDEEKDILKILRQLTSVIICNGLYCDMNYPIEYHNHEMEE